MEAEGGKNGGEEGWWVCDCVLNVKLERRRWWMESWVCGGGCGAGDDNGGYKEEEFDGGHHC